MHRHFVVGFFIDPSHYYVLNYIKMKIRIPRVVRDLGVQFSGAGFSAYLVGGAVRNLILKEKPSDFDIATDATPEKIKTIFRRVVPTGIKHGTVTVFFKGHQFEITTFRSEGIYSDARRPDSVCFVSDLEEDLKRRDFTINAIAVDTSNSLVTDPHDGQTDLKKRIIRAVGDPNERFSEDGLRLLRACRFACQLEFSIEDTTLRAMVECAGNIEHVSAERIRDEINKILTSNTPSIGFLAMDAAGLLNRILPELTAGRGVLQRGVHEFDVMLHSLYSCDGAPKANIEVRLAALLHDIGKPEAQQETEDEVTVFYQHERLSAEAAGDILTRLKYPNTLRKEVLHLIRNHMFSYEPGWTDAAVRRFLKRVGPSHVNNLFALRMADGFGMRRKSASGIGLNQLRERIDSVIEKNNAIAIGDLKVNGDDLAEFAGVPKGPEMGKVLDLLLESVIDDPKLNEREALLTIAQRFYTSYLEKKEN